LITVLLMPMHLLYYHRLSQFGYLILVCFVYHTESQNHRIIGVGRDLCGSSSPTLNIILLLAEKEYVK